MSLYALPGLMTAPEAPKSQRRLAMPMNGILSAVVWESVDSNTPISVRVVRLRPNHTYEILLDDPSGRRVLPLRMRGDRYAYTVKLMQSVDNLPCGDLELWVKVGESENMVFSLHVPERVHLISRPSANAPAAVTSDVIWGSVDIPETTQLFTFSLPRQLAAQPVWANAELVDTLEDAEEVQVIFSTIIGYDRNSMQVIFSSPIPRAGYKLSYELRTVLTTNNPNLQLGQTLIPQGTTTQDIFYTNRMSGPPALEGVLQSVSGQEAPALSYTLTGVTDEKFTLTLTSPTPTNLLLNWQART